MRPPAGDLKVVFCPSPCFLQVFILRGLELHFAEVRILKRIPGGAVGASSMSSSFMVPPRGGIVPPNQREYGDCAIDGTDGTC